MQEIPDLTSLVIQLLLSTVKNPWGAGLCFLPVSQLLQSNQAPFSLYILMSDKGVNEWVDTGH